MEFITHAINFRMLAKLDQMFNSNLRLYEVYLIASKKKPISTSSKIKHRLDK